VVDETLSTLTLVHPITDKGDGKQQADCSMHVGGTQEEREARLKVHNELLAKKKAEEQAIRDAEYAKQPKLT